MRFKSYSFLCHFSSNASFMHTELVAILCSLGSSDIVVVHLTDIT